MYLPQGRPREAAQGATVLDCLWHTQQCGNRTVSANVNGRNVGIRHQLQNGDSGAGNNLSTQEPQPDWLNRQ